MIARRSLLLGLSAAATLGGRAAFATTPGENRLVVIILRGALDGLAAVAPYGDAEYRSLRGPLAMPEPGQEGGALDLGGRFGLSPAMPRLAALYRSGEAAIVHAVAGPYRGRSHFDGQDWMESGAEQRLSGGWLNRAVIAAWPAEAAAPQGTNQGRSRKALVAGPAVPLLMKGPAHIANHAPRNLGRVPEDALRRLAALYAADTLLGPAVADARAGRAFADGALGPMHGPAANAAGDRAAFRSLALAAGRLLATADGPRVAALELGGFDTHAMQAQRLPGLLGTLDDAIAALREGLGPVWGRTAILAMTEFGRTVAANGTGGTDHGTGGVAFLAGGAVAGGKVAGTWPGLSPAALHEGRDLAPTTDLRAIAKALLAGQLGVSRASLDGAVFPASAAVTPMAGLRRG
ncbi:DUF1501 domain-containing protein [Elioraea sp.]|uniref:DUF1501 domain-containing protein n=1 Tax=Elioraea sp. TaxID=2185103 RepID=UPI0025B84E87|nr:DUF1501 domain-containing protein [Elioraea sp.]